MSISKLKEQPISAIQGAIGRALSDLCGIEITVNIQSLNFDQGVPWDTVGAQMELTARRSPPPPRPDDIPF